MKVKCIDSHGYSFITIGKTYDVINIVDGWYYIINNNDYKDCYEKERFKTPAEIRNEKIDKLLEK